MANLAGTWTLTRLALRRDRILIPVAVLGFAGLAGSSAAATRGLYPDPSELLSASEAVNGTAALVALYGRIYDPGSVGAISVFKLTAFGAAMLSVLMVVMVVRHTRADEETGRLELLQAGVLGRYAPLAAALIVSMGTSLLLGLATAAALAGAGLPASGSLAFGLGWAVTGICFAAVAGVCAQVTVGPRAAIGLGLVVVAAAYVLRAVGDLAENAPGWQSWLSPIGWNQQVRAYAGDRWEVLALPLLATVVAVPLAVLLRSRRDFGAGFLAERPGRSHGRIRGAFGLAWRLQRGTLVAVSIAILLLGLVLGSIADNISGFFDSPTMVAFLEMLGGRQALVDAFLATEIAFAGIFLSAYGIAAVERLHSEENAGRAEVLLATATGRLRWLASHVVVALLGAAWLAALTGAAMGAGYALATEDPGQVGRLTAAALAQVPAIWVVTAAAAAIWALWPQASAAIWALYVAYIVVGEFGRLWELPQWVLDASPYIHSPLLPGKGVPLTGLWWLLGTAALLLLVAAVAFRRRDLKSN